MPSTQKRDIVEKYSSYEEVVEGWKASKVYRATIKEPWDHYIMNYNDEGDVYHSIKSSPYIKDLVLVWSEESGEIVPFKHPNPKHFIQNQEKIRKQNEALKNNSENKTLDQTINQEEEKKLKELKAKVRKKEDEIKRIQSTIFEHEKAVSAIKNHAPKIWIETLENQVSGLRNKINNKKDELENSKIVMAQQEKSLSDAKKKKPFIFKKKHGKIINKIQADIKDSNEKNRKATIELKELENQLKEKLKEILIDETEILNKLRDKYEKAIYELDRLKI